MEGILDSEAVAAWRLRDVTVSVVPSPLCYRRPEVLRRRLRKRRSTPLVSPS
jgi:hypothetical protein